MNRRKGSRRAFIATLAVLSAATPRAIRAQPALTHVRIAVSPSEGGMEPYYAYENGFFQKAGLDVELSVATSGAVAITSVVAGAIDLSTTTVPGLAAAVLHGIPLQYFAAAALWNSARPFAGVLVAKDSPIRTARDFEGKTFGIVTLHDGTHLVALAYLIKNGADPSKVSFIETPFSVMQQAVATGRIAGALSAEPFMPGPTDDATRVLALGYDALGDHYLSLGFFSSADWIKANVATVRKVRSVLYDAARWANNRANWPRSSEIVVKYSKMTPETVAHLTRATFAEQLNPSMVDPWLDWSYRLKFIDRPLRGTDIVAAV